MQSFHLLLGAIAASIATIVAVVIVHDPLPATYRSRATWPAPADPFNGLHLSAPISIDEDLNNDEKLNSPFVSYQSDTFGYKIRYPGNWYLDDTRSEFAGDILSDPSERVVVTISETVDPTLVTPEGMEAMAQSIEESLQLDPAFSLQKFQRLIWKHRPTIYTDGIRMISGERFHTRVYNIFRKNHNGVLNVSITTQEDAEVLYEQALQEVLNSLDVCPKRM